VCLPHSGPTTGRRELNLVQIVLAALQQALFDSVPRSPLGLCPSWASLEAATCLCAPLQDPTTGQRSSVLCRSHQINSLASSGCGPQFALGPSEPALCARTGPVCRPRPLPCLNRSESTSKPCCLQEQHPRDIGDECESDSRRFWQVLRFFGRSAWTSGRRTPMRPPQDLRMDPETSDLPIVCLCYPRRTQGSSFITFGRALGKPQPIFRQKAWSLV
jgi:hypothetical protein